MNPNLGLTFPLEKKGKKVFLKHAILINSDCVVPAGSHLRVMYLLPKAGESDAKKPHRRSDDYNPAFSRQRIDRNLGEKDELTPEQRDIYNRAMKTVWNEDVSFRAALERWDLQHSRFVFQRPGKEDIEVENFDFPEGMFLAEIGGKITVLYVEKDSPASEIGIIPQTILLSLNGRSFEGNLETFRNIYIEEKSKKQSTNRLLNFSALLPNSADPKTLTLKLPLSLNSDIWSIK